MSISECFTAEANKAIELAKGIAKDFNSEFIATEHILLGIMNQPACDAASLLRLLEVDRKKVEAEIIKLAPASLQAKTLPEKLPFTPLAKNVLVLAAEEAAASNVAFVDTIRILFGLMMEKEGVAARALTALGLTLEKLNDPRVRPTRTEVDPTAKKKEGGKKAEAKPPRVVTKLDYFKEVVAQQIDAISCNGELTLVLSFHAAGGGQIIGLSFQGYGEQEDES